MAKTDGEGFKSVNYAKLSAVLLQVVKEQQKNIDELTSRLEKVESFLERNNSYNVKFKVAHFYK